MSAALQSRRKKMDKNSTFEYNYNTEKLRTV